MKMNWVGLAAMSDQLICERCLGPFAFPQGTLDFEHTPWRYRVVGPFSVPDFAGGAYATVLALRVFGDMVAGLGDGPRDLLRWLQWDLDRMSNQGAVERLIDHAAYLWRDGLNTVFGMDESGHMDAMGLGWLLMAPEGDRPLILQKAGGLQGIFSYAAFVPARNIGVMAAINAFDVNAGLAMAKAANDLIAELAPR
jgi:CubicO group peptidase (beta-lactamase class C family)